MRRSIFLSFVSFVLFLVAVGPAAAQVTLLDQTFVRTPGEPATVQVSFAAVEGKGTISAYNGGAGDGGGRRVSDATIRLNGSVVFDENDFNQRVAYLEAEVDLLATNDLEVFLQGSPGGKVTIRVAEPPLAITEFWERLARLYESSPPSEAELTAWFAANVAPDIVHGGTDYDELLAEWLAGGGPVPGMTFSPAVTGPLDVTGTAYTKGYRVRVECTWDTFTFTFDTAMVFDGTRWLWYGDQQWVQPQFGSLMNMSVWWDGATVFETGLSMTLSDESNFFAYRHGVRSAIVTGPGLPPAGLKLYHMYPLPYLRLYPNDPQHAEGRFLQPLSDAIIATIPDNAEYTFRLYSQEAGDVTLADTPLTTFHVTNPKPPLLNADLSASTFPTLLAPTTHNSSELNIGGDIEVRWTNPSATTTVRYAAFGLTQDSKSFRGVSSEIAPGATSVTFDTSAYPSPPWRGASLGLVSADQFGRGYGFMWLINPWM